MSDKVPKVISWTPSDWDCICQLAKSLEMTEANFIEEIVDVICIDDDESDLDVLLTQYELIMAIKKKQKRKLRYSKESIKQSIFLPDPNKTR